MDEKYQEPKYNLQELIRKQPALPTAKFMIKRSKMANFILRRYLTVVIMLLLSLNTAQADGIKSTSEVKAAVGAAMQKAQSDNFSDFFLAIKPYWTISEEGFTTALAKTTSARAEVHKKMGKSLGVEQVKIEMVSDTVLKIVFLEKFQKSLMIWNFYFYKPNTEWFLNTFEWDDNIRTLF
jgi:hypothetical protein